MQQRVFDLALKDQAYPHLALGGSQQSTAEMAAWKEVGAGDDRLGARRAQVPEVGALDVPAMAHAVAYHQRRALGAGVRTRPGRRIPESPTVQPGPRHLLP